MTKLQPFKKTRNYTTNNQVLSPLPQAGLITTIVILCKFLHTITLHNKYHKIFYYYNIYLYYNYKVKI